jgi:Ribonuclease G/E
MNQRQIDCPDCAGTGKYQGHRCPKCAGDGYIISTHTEMPLHIRQQLATAKENLTNKVDAETEAKRQDIAQRKEAMKQAATDEITADMLRPAVQLLIAKNGLYAALNELLTFDQRQELELDSTGLMG